MIISLTLIHSLDVLFILELWSDNFLTNQYSILLYLFVLGLWSDHLLFGKNEATQPTQDKLLSFWKHSYFITIIIQL